MQKNRMFVPHLSGVSDVFGRVAKLHARLKSR